MREGNNIKTETTGLFRLREDDEDTIELESTALERGTVFIGAKKFSGTGEDLISRSQTQVIDRRDLEDKDVLREKTQTISKGYESGYTLPFVQHKTKELVIQLTVEFKRWSEYGTSDSLIYISNIKSLLDRYSKYLDCSQESRLLVGTLQLIFVDEKWEEITPKQVKSVYLELKRFEDGVVEKEGFNIFSKQLLRLGINPLT